MKKKHLAVGRYISMLHRMNNSHFCRRLEQFGLRGGQQVFVMHLAKHPGCTFQELAQVGDFDKATATRAVRKLEEDGYVRLEMDPEDKRVKHIYLTKKADPLLEETWKAVQDWTEVITAGFTEEEKLLEQSLLERMVMNAHEYIEQMRREDMNQKSDRTGKEES